MSNTPSYREQLVGQLFALYADLGWAVPTSIEYARLTHLEDTLGVALNAKEARERRAPMFEAVGFVVVDVTE
jgi:hypothetical protein